MSNVLRRLPVLLHGEHPAPLNVALVYIVGLLAAFFIVSQSLTAVALSPFQVVVLFILALDICGGVVANSTPATNRWYHERPLMIRLVFVLVHAVHPLVAVLVLDPGNWLFFGALYAYMLLTTTILLLLPFLPRVTISQRPLAFAFFALGVVGASYVLDPVVTLQWFAPAYFAKLIIGFAVDYTGAHARRTNATESDPVPQTGPA